MMDEIITLNEIELYPCHVGIDVMFDLILIIRDPPLSLVY